jgi:hypothetical protein
MADVRKRRSPKDKATTLATEKCYVCADLGLDHAGFDGYDAREVDFDHYQTPFGSLGGPSTDTLPIHAATGGSIPDDADFETSTRRNCHRLRSNQFTTRAGYVAVLRARLELRSVSYIDYVKGNKGRNPSSNKYHLPVRWEDGKADFIDKTYPVISEERRGIAWRRFLTTVRPDQTFTDSISQVRPAVHKNLSLMVQTFLADGFPMFAPVNARIDPCGHVVIFDGNHRATAHAISFGVLEPMPVMIWDIKKGDDCAIREDVLKDGGGN